MSLYECECCVLFYLSVSVWVCLIVGVFLCKFLCFYVSVVLSVPVCGVEGGHGGILVSVGAWV